jgi:hypothetical protein
MVKRVEWIVSRSCPRSARDRVLSRLLEWERQGRCWVWQKHWHDDEGRFRYKCVITPLYPPDMIAIWPYGDVDTKDEGTR